MPSRLGRRTSPRQRLVCRGGRDRSRDPACRQGQRDSSPGSSEFAVHAGCLLAALGRHADAIGYLSRAAEIEPDDAAVLRQLSGRPLLADDNRELALDLALRAHAAGAGRPRRRASMRRELLLRCERFDEAAEIITGSARRRRRRHDRGIGCCRRRRCCAAGSRSALEAIDRALALAPAEAEYHLHRGNLLYRLGRFDEAAAAFDRAASLDPENPAARRSQLAVYFDSGRFREALAVGGELIRSRPRQRGIRPGGAAGIEPPARNHRRRLHRAGRALRRGQSGRRGRSPAFGRRCAPSGASFMP